MVGWLLVSLRQFSYKLNQLIIIIIIIIMILFL